MTKRAPKEKAQLSTSDEAVRGYRETAKMLAKVESARRLSVQPYGHRPGKRARKFIMLELYPMELATFLGLVGIGSVLNGTRTKEQLLALVDHGSRNSRQRRAS